MPDCAERFSHLPVAAVLPEIRSVLRKFPAAVLSAPPGSGKTTLVPPGLLDGFAKMIMLEPRRLAAKAAACRIGEILGEEAGGIAGYRVRGESRISPNTRIEVVTEGVLTRMLQLDPELAGVELLIFDEFHERHLEGDLALALALDSAKSLRPDLRILVMSATLDCEAVPALLGNAPVIRCSGTLHPVEVHWGEGFGDSRDAGVRASGMVRRVLQAEKGDILVFLPGAGEIRTAEENLRDLASESLRIEPLYGSMEFKKQQSVLAPAPPGCRKVVLATNVAESSLTIEGIRTVIDSGFERVSKFDPASGMEKLVTVRASASSMRQRAGRAGRLGPGAVYRFCTAEEFAALPFNRMPEMLSSDLSGLVLNLACWGALPEQLPFLDAPPVPAWNEGRNLLRKLGALSEDGRLTPKGRTMGSFPAHPRLAAMMYEASRQGCAPLAAELAALVSERDIGGAGSDLRERLDKWRSREKAYPALNAARDALLQPVRTGFVRQSDAEAGRILAWAYPDRIGRRRGHGFLLASGRGAACVPGDDMAFQEWVVAANLDGGGSSSRIRLALPYREAFLREDFPVGERSSVRLENGRVTAFREEVFGAVVLCSVRPETPDAADAAKLLGEEILRRGEAILKLDTDAASWLARLRFARKFSPGEWQDPAEHWEEILLFSGCRSLEDLQKADWKTLFRNWLGVPSVRKLDSEYPERFETPAGSKIRMDYSGETPVLAVKVQEMYGLNTHPSIGNGRLPLVLALLSPAGRPLQVTGDLPGFWRGSWAGVRKEMRGRYPKHVWPENPARAEPTTRAKRKNPEP